jgi:hypothetical protein
MVAGRDSNQLKLTVDSTTVTPVSDSGMGNVDQSNTFTINTSASRSADEVRLRIGSYPSATEIATMYANYSFSGDGWYSVSDVFIKKSLGNGMWTGVGVRV